MAAFHAPTEASISGTHFQTYPVIELSKPMGELETFLASSTVVMKKVELCSPRW